MARWTVTNQRQEDRLTAQGTFEQMMVVTFTVYETNGTHTVEIPLRQYTAEFVRERIDEFADRLLEVHNL